jgi:Flp pilus assembly protein TadG
MRRFRRRGRDETGAELIEFALVFPLLLMTVLGIVDFGFLFQRYEVLTNAAREGARVAVLPGYTDTDIENRVVSFLQTGGIPTTAGNPLVTITDTTIPEGPGTHEATSVTLTYDYDYLFIGAIAGWFGGGFSTATLTTQATMRNELASAAGP